MLSAVGPKVLSLSMSMSVDGLQAPVVNAVLMLALQCQFYLTQRLSEKPHHTAVQLLLNKSRATTTAAVAEPRWHTGLHAAPGGALLEPTVTALGPSALL
jgi:hypothetical protein